MANTEIDSLSLDIQITGLKKEDVKNISTLSRAIAKLTSSLKEADFSKLKDIKVPKGLKNIQLITQNIKVGNNAQSQESTTDYSTMADELGELGYAYDELAGDIEDSALKIENADSKIKDSTRGLTKELKKAEEELEGKKTKVSGWQKATNKLSKIFSRFKTILFIKAVRAIINAVVQAVQQGVLNLAQFDKAFNQTMSNIKTSATQITNSLALITRPIIEILEPALVEIGRVASEIGNTISKTQASMKGLTSYTKINAKYMDDYANSAKKAQLFTFDTFNTLSGDNQNNMFVEEELTDEDVENTSEIASLISALQETLQLLLDVIGVLAKEIGKLLKMIAPALTKILNLVNRIIDALLPVVEDLLESLDPLLSVILETLLPALVDLLDAILKPILQLVKDLSPLLVIIVNILSNLLVPLIDYISMAIEMLSPVIEGILFVAEFKISSALEFIITLLDATYEILKPIFKVFEMIVEQANILKDAIGALLKGDFEAFGKGLIESMKVGLRGIAVLFAGLVDSIINGLIKSINAIIANKYVKKVVSAFGGDWEGITWRSDLASKVPSFANGGIVGELWQMNENGNPEMLYNSNNGNTAVITQDQLSMAFEQAIYNTGLLDVIQQAGVVSIDGRAIAQSTNFKNELNRTNPNLNIR